MFPNASLLYAFTLSPASRGPGPRKTPCGRAAHFDVGAAASPLSAISSSRIRQGQTSSVRCLLYPEGALAPPSAACLLLRFSRVLACHSLRCFLRFARCCSTHLPSSRSHRSARTQSGHLWRAQVAVLPPHLRHPRAHASSLGPLPLANFVVCVALQVSQSNSHLHQSEWSQCVNSWHFSSSCVCCVCCVCQACGPGLAPQENRDCVVDCLA